MDTDGIYTSITLPLAAHVSGFMDNGKRNYSQESQGCNWILRCCNGSTSCLLLRICFANSLRLAAGLAKLNLVSSGPCCALRRSKAMLSPACGTVLPPSGVVIVEVVILEADVFASSDDKDASWSLLFSLIGLRTATLNTRCFR